MVYSYEWLSTHVKKIPPPRELGELLTVHSYQVEEVRRTGNDYVLDIEILPNRFPDSAGHIGVAREITAITQSELLLPKTVLKKNGNSLAKYLKVKADFRGVRRYIISMLEDVRVKESTRLIQKRLKACGQRPINNIVDATNYVMLETGHPVHAFDLDKVQGGSIFVRFAKTGEKIKTQGGAELKLKAGHLVIADYAGPLAIAGVKGGGRAEITNKTKRVIFETAVFEPDIVRKTSKELGLVTDASQRFSHLLPYLELDRVAWRLLGLAQSMARGKASPHILDSHDKLPRKVPIELRRSRITSLLGREVPTKEVFGILRRLGARVTSKGEDAWLVIAPPDRLDISIEEDLVEEVGRIFGYKKIRAAAPLAVLAHPEEDEEHIMSDKLRLALKTFGFMEVLNYGLINVPDSGIELENPISGEYAFLRSSQLTGLLRNINTNLTYSRRQKLFELGHVFSRASGKPNAIQEYNLLTGVATFSDKARSENLFFEMKGVLDSLFREFGLGEFWFDDEDVDPTWPFSPSRCMHPFRKAYLKSNSENVGVIFEVHPLFREGFNAVAFEIMVPQFMKQARAQYEFLPLPRYPAVVRDISLLVPREVRVDEVGGVLEHSGGNLLADTDLFDYYENGLDENKKSLAFHLLFQSPERTLTEEEVNKIMEKIVQRLNKEGWEVRE